LSIQGVRNSTNLYESGTTEEVRYSLCLARFPHTYIVSAVLPESLIILVSSLTYWVRIAQKSTERLAFSATLLLTISAITLFTSEKRPASGMETWLDEYQAWSFFLTFLPLLHSSIVIWIHAQWEDVIDSAKEEDPFPRATRENSFDSGAFTDHPVKYFLKQFTSRHKTALERANLPQYGTHMVVDLLLRCDFSCGYGTRMTANPAALDLVGLRIFTLLVIILHFHMWRKIPSHAGGVSALVEGHSTKVLLFPSVALTAVLVMSWMGSCLMMVLFCLQSKRIKQRRAQSTMNFNVSSSDDPSGILNDAVSVVNPDTTPGDHNISVDVVQGQEDNVSAEAAHDQDLDVSLQHRRPESL